MNKFTYKLATAASTAVIALGSFGPAALGATVTVTGNGADSSNHVDLDLNSSTTVQQSNTAVVTNNVSSNASTGGNDANKNTGGDTSIDTGNASTKTTVNNAVNSNVATVDNCNCGQDVNVKVSGNGADSYNKVDLDVNQGHDTGTIVAQSNSAVVTNNVSSTAKTGGNDANKNTGGDVEISTGNASTDTTVSNNVNSNWARVGSSHGNGGGVDVEISGNGADSRNKVYLDLDNSTWVTQENEAIVTNTVDSYASTGYNDANKNTGGDVSIDTGDADVTGDVTNHVNFNAADLTGCECEMDLGVKIAGNGADSYNKVDLDTDLTSGVAQGNGAVVTNDATDNDAKTGGNDANKNTGTPMGGDPSVMTGDASSDFTVDNSVNSNVSGDVEMPDWSDMFGGTNVNFNGFVMWLMAHWS